MIDPTIAYDYEDDKEHDHLLEVSKNKIIKRYDTIYHYYKSQYPFINESEPYIASGIYISHDCDGNIPCNHYIHIEYNSKADFTSNNIKIADFYTIRKLLVSNAIALPTHFLENEEYRYWRQTHNSDYLKLRKYTPLTIDNNNNRKIRKTQDTTCLCCNIQ
jgi:hypothetical protein